MIESISNTDALKKTIGYLSDQIPDWDAYLQSDGPGLITFCNPYSVQCIRKFKDFEQLMERFDHVFADGILLVKAAQLVCRKDIVRLSFDGNSLASTVWQICRERNLEIALIGGVEGIADQAAAILRANGVQVAQTHSGFFSSPEARQSLIERLKDSNVKVVVAGMGAPYQERFAIDLVNSGFQGKVFTCGGYLDQMVNAQGTQYYPEWINRFNLRFVYRVYREPKRLLHRYTVGYADFYRGTLGACLNRR
ncbi:WecB/TagA/CpsF family glycosyltransferase [Planctomicrobium sp. SH668]|uniref:WecB/TagA/CpsF family glycosyltransferase n=1 Tax=Planctomicrobium sp. SH668 TaxID=3448126 RepID=UPI003F5C90A3